MSMTPLAWSLSSSGYDQWLSGTSAGGLWVVKAASPQAVQSLIEADPFWPTGLRKSVRVLEWTQVFADGKRRI